jgi:hypothetical protein
MARNLYTKPEILLCTYAAMYDAEDFGGLSTIQKLQDRSLSSIKLKISNIAAMLDEESVPRKGKVSPLSGLPRGECGRRTNWPWVQSLCSLNQKSFLTQCIVTVKA